MTFKTRSSSSRQVSRKARRTFGISPSGRIRQRKIARRMPKVQIEDENGVIYGSRLIEATDQLVRVQIDTAAIADGPRQNAANPAKKPSALDEPVDRVGPSRTIQFAPKDAAIDLGRRIAEKRAALMRSLADA